MALLKTFTKGSMVVHDSLRPAIFNGGKTWNVGVKSSPLLGGDGSNFDFFSYFFQMGWNSTTNYYIQRFFQAALLLLTFFVLIPLCMQKELRVTRACNEGIDEALEVQTYQQADEMEVPVRWGPQKPCGKWGWNKFLISRVR